MSEYNYYWFSWVEKSEDHRPINYPPNENILGWWCSGYDCEDNATLCAMVKAKDEDDVLNYIELDWPGSKDAEIRFCEQTSNLDLSDRFPKSDWMIERFNNEI